MDYRNLAEEELKLRIAEQFFPTYDCAHRIGKIDFTVAVPGPKGGRPVRATSGQEEDHTTTEFQSLLWAEAKRGIVSDIYKPLVQLVLTIGRARTFDTYLPPPFLGVFDAGKEFGAITMRSPRQTPTLRIMTSRRTFRGETRTARLSARTPILRLGSHSAFPVATKRRATQDRSGRQTERTTPYTPSATGIANARNGGRARPQPPLRAS